jgi:hypothetical protein
MSRSFSGILRELFCVLCSETREHLERNREAEHGEKELAT